MHSEVQREYGGALWQLCAEENCTQEMRADVLALLSVLREQPEYLRLLASPDIPARERLELLDAALRGKAHPYLLNFLKLLCERGHIACASDCLEEYCRRYDEANRIENVTVWSAVELTRAQKEALGRKLSEKLEKNVRLTVEVDPTLLGGIRVQTQSESFDGTIRSKMETIRHNLLQTVL